MSVTNPRLSAAIGMLALVGLATATTAAIVDLPADPPTRRTVALSEQWRIGADDEDVLLGVITGVVVDAAGQVYLVDRQLSQVVVMSPDGEYVATLGREGDGPGELRRPHMLVTLDDAGTIGVVQGFPGKIIGLDAEGNPAGDITLGGNAAEGGFAFLRDCVRVGDRFYADTGRMTFDPETGKVNRTTSLAVFDREGQRVALLAEDSRANDMSKPSYDEAAEYTEFSTWAVGPDGRVYTTPERERFLLRVRDSEGAEVMTLQRPFTPRTRTADEKAEVASGIDFIQNGRRLEVETNVQDTDPAIRELEVGSDGRLYVTNCNNYRRYLPVGTAGRYDVISPEGKFLEELTVTVPGFNGEEDVLFFIDGTHFLVIRNFDDASDALDAGSGEDGEADAEAADLEPAPLKVIYLTLASS